VEPEYVILVSLSASVSANCITSMLDAVDEIGLARDSICERHWAEAYSRWIIDTISAIASKYTRTAGSSDTSFDSFGKSFSAVAISPLKFANTYVVWSMNKSKSKGSSNTSQTREKCTA
jgi:hypothetical protein